MTENDAILFVDKNSFIHSYLLKNDEKTVNCQGTNWTKSLVRLFCWACRLQWRWKNAGRNPWRCPTRFLTQK